MAELPVQPPLAPMLAKLRRQLPVGDYVYEPKWDGFRCIAFIAGGDVDLRSRNDRGLARYFPELVAGRPRPRQSRSCSTARSWAPTNRTSTS